MTKREVWSRRTRTAARHKKVDATREAKFARFRATFIKLARNVNTLTDGSVEDVKQIIAENDLVVGVWPDISEADHFGLMVIKGSNLLRELTADFKPIKVKYSAIPCRDREQAEGAAILFGDRPH